MDNRIKIIIPSLQDMALIKIATSLWNESNIIRGIFTKPMRTDSDGVKANIQRLDLPLALRSRIDSITIPIRHQITLWFQHSLYVNCYWCPKYLHLFYWTSQGTLDMKSTIMGLLRNEEINVFDRFIMACNCCLESEIHSLWDRIDKNSLDLQQVQEQLLSNGIVKFWTFKMDPNISRLQNNRIKASFNPRSCNNYLRIIQEAITDENFLAVKYFFSKLAPTSKKYFFFPHFLSKVFKNVALFGDYTSPDIFNFLFSSMDQEFQKQLLNKYSYEILFTFRDWPWHNHFLEYSKLCWNFLSLQEFYKLLKIIIYYEVVFQEFWMQSPISFRRFMVNNEFNDLFSCLDDDDEHKISLFLKHTSLEERKRIIFSDCGMETCRYFFARKRLVLVSRFLAECLSTAELVVNFREDFVEFPLARSRRLRHFEIEKSELLRGVDDIFDLLLKKRSDEENGCSER